MRMARVCQADGAAIAAAAARHRNLRDEKHEIVVARSRRDRTCFLSPFFASSGPRPLRLPIKSDLTSIYLRIFQRPRRPPFLLLPPVPPPPPPPPHRVAQLSAASRMNFASQPASSTGIRSFCQRLTSLIRSCSYRSGSLGTEILRIGFIGGVSYSPPANRCLSAEQRYSCSSLVIFHSTNCSSDAVCSSLQPRRVIAVINNAAISFSNIGLQVDT